jgi:hypothetical protein
MRGIGWLVRCYPAWWRDRYGDEFAALLEGLPTRPGGLLDVLLGAVDARLQAPPRPAPVPPPPLAPLAPPPPPPPAPPPPPHRGRGAIVRELGIDRVIREAIERGAFDDLPGQGKPLDLSSYDPANEWRLAFHVVQQAGETLPWIALGRDVEAARGRLEALLAQARAGAAQRRGDRTARQRQRAMFLDQAQRLDALIASYNANVPTIRLQQARLPTAQAEAHFDAAWPAA